MSCSCGYPARMKMPCRHILALVGEPHTIMFGIRWLAQYQHSFMRPDSDALTNIFRLMDKLEQNQDVKAGDCVNVNGVFDVEKLNISCYPQALGRTSTSDMSMILSLFNLQKSGRLFQRGWSYKLLSDESFLSDGLSINKSTDKDIELFCSDTSKGMFESDVEFEKDYTKLLQDIQKKNMKLWSQSKIHKESEALGIFRDCIKLVEDSPDDFNHFLESLKNTHHMLLNKTNKNKAGTGSQSISFPNTGHTKKRAEKRKKTCGV